MDASTQLAPMPDIGLKRSRSGVSLTPIRAALPSSPSPPPRTPRAGTHTHTHTLDASSAAAAAATELAALLGTRTVGGAQEGGPVEALNPNRAPVQNGHLSHRSASGVAFADPLAALASDAKRRKVLAATVAAAAAAGPRACSPQESDDDDDDDDDDDGDRSGGATPEPGSAAAAAAALMRSASSRVPRAPPPEASLFGHAPPRPDPATGRHRKSSLLSGPPTPVRPGVELLPPAIVPRCTVADVAALLTKRERKAARKLYRKHARKIQKRNHDVYAASAAASAAARVSADLAAAAAPPPHSPPPAAATPSPRRSRVRYRDELDDSDSDSDSPPPLLIGLSAAPLAKRGKNLGGAAAATPQRAAPSVAKENGGVTAAGAAAAAMPILRAPPGVPGFVGAVGDEPPMLLTLSQVSSLVDRLMVDYDYKLRAQYSELAHDRVREEFAFMTEFNRELHVNRYTNAVPDYIS